MPTAPRVFDAHAADYDALRRRLVPVFDALYEAAVGALSLASGPVRRVLDVGAGTGLLSEFVHRALPDVELTLLDGSPAMLAAARARLGDAATYLEQDFADALPAGPWDAVVSALAIHHFADAGKRALFAQIHDRLAPGGVFVNAEHVAGPTPHLDAHYAAWHRARCVALGATPAEWAAAVRRMSFDRLATVDDQLAWLRDAGYAEVDCLFKHHGFAVILAAKAG
jgi:tRNA (cmo5U34)-methyltransferase